MMEVSAPMTKANWTVVEPDGLPHAIYRAFQVAKTPPVGAVHLAIYDRVFRPGEVSTNIIEGGLPDLRVGYPDDESLEEVARILHDAERPVLYVGDGVWKSGADAQLIALAEYFGTPITGSIGAMRTVPLNHSLYCGGLDAAETLDADYIICVGVRHAGPPTAFPTVKGVIAIGSGSENLKNIQGLEVAILADE